MAKQSCKDCDGLGYDTTILEWVECPTCEGIGWHDRTGPYRLADGTWSDGVDRTERINRDEFADANPDRVTVICQQGIYGRWFPESWVYRGNSWLHDVGLPHAEAIAYADRTARTTKNGDNK